MTQVNLAANRRLARSRLMWRCAPTGAEIMGRARFSHKPAAGPEPADVAQLVNQAAPRLAATG